MSYTFLLGGMSLNLGLQEELAKEAQESEAASEEEAGKSDDEAEEDDDDAEVCCHANRLLSVDACCCVK